MKGDYIVGLIFIGLIVGIVLGAFIGIGCSDSGKIQDKLREIEFRLDKVTTERDTYKNLIVQKSLED